MIAIPIWLENAVISDDGSDVARAGANAFGHLPYFGMPATAGPDVLNFAIGLVEFAQGKPAFCGSDVQQIMGIQRTLPAANLFHLFQGKGKGRFANGVFTPYA